METADHQNKPDVANSKAQEMYDRKGVDLILDVPTSSAALEVADVAKEKKKLYFNIGAATTDLTGKSCNKYTFHYAYDTYMLANGTGKTTTEQIGKNWYILYPNYAFGQDMEKSFSTAITAAGGTVVGKDATPFPNARDFSTFLLKAPNLNPKPDVLGTMQAGGDLVNVVKQYNEFKLRDKGVGLAVGLMFLTDIHSLTPAALAGTTYTDAWYWNFDAKNRALADRFQAEDRHPADLRARRQLLRGVAVPGGGAGRRHRRRRRRGQGARGQEGQGRLPAQRQDPRRGPPGGARRVPGPGEAAGRGQGAVGLREGPQDDPRRGGVPRARRRTASCESERSL